MTLPTTISGQVAINATDVWPRLHAEHGDGRHSLALTPENEAVSIYVRGTHAELLDLAAKIVASVPVVESVPSSTPPASPRCVDCERVMQHDQGPYWFCIDTECPAYMHTILIDNAGKRSHVGMMR